MLGALPGIVLVAMMPMAGVQLEAKSLVAYIPLVGVPVGAALGWWHAPAVAAARRLPVGRLVLLGAEAMVLGLMVMALIGGVMSWLDSPTMSGVTALAGGAASVIVFGLVFLGLPMLALTTACAFGWGVLLRRTWR